MPVIVCFLRHGKSDPPDSVEDEARQLLDEGGRELRAAAATWRRLGLHPDVVVTSPRRRSIDSARLFAEGVGLELVPIVVDALAPGASWSDFAAILEQHADAGSITIVGHEPDLSRAVEHLTGAASIRLGEGGLCCVELADGASAASGILTLLLDPAVYAGDDLSS